MPSPEFHALIECLLELGVCCAGDYLGTPYPLPVLAPEATGANLLHGVNYASAGAGILEETGAIFVRNHMIDLSTWRPISNPLLKSSKI